MERRRFLSVLAAPVGSSLAGGAAGETSPVVHRLKGTRKFPNSVLPALVYPGALAAGEGLASAFEALFARNGWGNSWRNGLYKVHHYHSTAHEVLGVYRGEVRVCLGGEDGVRVTLRAGDVAVLPAGVAHKNESQSSDFAVVGAYPEGTSPDMQYGEEGERPRADQNIARVKLPASDPVKGKTGALTRLWR
jgi:uncharacterized protein YjlB